MEFYKILVHLNATFLIPNFHFHSIWRDPRPADSLFSLLREQQSYGFLAVPTEKRLRAIQREMVKPYYDKKDEAKLAAQEAAFAAPKLPVPVDPSFLAAT
ncbi:hypothetical protein ACFX13_025705 [Malus domestica]